MKIDVIVNYQGTMKCEDEWTDYTEDLSVCCNNWSTRANNIVSYSKIKKMHYSVDVFLFLDYDFWHELKDLEDYLRIIHQHTFLSSDVYLVIDRRFEREQEEQKKIHQAALIRSFTQLNKLHFCDILQADVSPGIKTIRENSLGKLKSLVDISRERKIIMESMLAESNNWQFDLYWVIHKLSAFLHKTPNLLSEKKQDNDLNTVVVMDSNWNDYNRRQIQRSIKSKKGRNIIAICTTNVDERLEEFAIENDVDILKFSGFFDIRYFLHLYDYFLQNTFENKNLNNQFTNTDLEDYIDDDELPKDFEKLFVKKSNNSKVTSLITSAFDPNDFDCYNHLLNPLASQAMFDLFKDYSGEKFVIPIVTPSNLKEYLNELLPNLLVWVHFGHGSETGLQNFGGYFSNIEEWLDSFKGLGISLRLAFFFSCESARVAERFRDAGVRIAIGFEEKVLMKDCMELAKIIIPLALNGNDDGEIKQVFEERCKSLGQDYFERCKPQIFFLNE